MQTHTVHTANDNEACGMQHTTYATTYDEHFKINVKIQELYELNIYKNN